MNENRILIVDDSSFARDIHKQYLKAAGYQLLEAANGADAQVIFEKEKPDLCLVDLLLTDMDGMDVVRKLRKIDPAAKIVICSTDIQSYRKDEAKELGVLEFLEKPIIAEKTLDLLHSIFNEPDI